MGCCKNIKKNQEENKKPCPLCKKEGNNIHQLVIVRLVKEEVVPEIKEDTYFTCHHQDCDVVFFNEAGDRVILAQDINMGANFDEVTVSKVHKNNCHSKCSTCGNNNTE